MKIFELEEFSLRVTGTILKYSKTIWKRKNRKEK